MAVSDRNGAIYHPDGLDLAALFKAAQQEGEFSVSDQKGAAGALTGEELLEPEQVLQRDWDEVRARAHAPRKGIRNRTVRDSLASRFHKAPAARLAVGH